MCYCPKCQKDVSSVIRGVKEIYPVLGEPTEIIATVRFCDDCGESIFDEVLDQQNLQDAFYAYREKHNISRSKKLVRSRSC